MLGDAFVILFGVGVMMIGTWLVIFGAGGAFLSRSYGSSMTIGAVLGILLGPLGWGIIWFINRAEDEVLPDPTDSTSIGP